MKMAYRVIRLQWLLFRPITVGVRIMIIRNSEVLMVRHTYVPGWNFPGGLVERNETPAEAAVREAQEEAGIVCTNEPRLFGLFSKFDQGKSDHNAVFLCEDFEMKPRSDRWEIAEVAWFPLDGLPEDASRGSKARVVEYLNEEIGLAGQW